jgi:hypothetical protein
MVAKRGGGAGGATRWWGYLFRVVVRSDNDNRLWL